MESQLRNLGVQAIDVNYQIKGQKPVLEMLKSVPLGAPQKIAECWESNRIKMKEEGADDGSY